MLGSVSTRAQATRTRRMDEDILHKGLPDPLTSSEETTIGGSGVQSMWGVFCSDPTSRTQRKIFDLAGRTLGKNH